MTVVARVTRRLGDQAVSQTLELPMPPAPGVRLALDAGELLVIARVTIAPRPAWGPGIVLRLVAVETAPEPPAGLAEAQGLSQVALARTAKIGRITLVRLEAGTQAPTLETLERVARALRVSVSKLLG